MNVMTVIEFLMMTSNIDKIQNKINIPFSKSSYHDRFVMLCVNSMPHFYHAFGHIFKGLMLTDLTDAKV